MALFDFDLIYLAVQEFKQMRSWSNLRLERSRLVDFCLTKNDWYTLYVRKLRCKLIILQPSVSKKTS